MQGLIDIGSTIIKVVVRRDDGLIISHDYVHRDYDATIAGQVAEIVRELANRNGHLPLRICSSANSGIRVGLLSLSRRFSGTVAANLILAAGANLVFQQDFNGGPVEGHRESVDLLVVAGGADLPDMPRLESRIHSLNLEHYGYDKILYAGNSFLWPAFAKRYPRAIRVENVIGNSLALHSEDLLSKIRMAYLEDLVDKHGMKTVQQWSTIPIWPTPGVVNLAFQAVSCKECGPGYPDPFIVLDIGGATTDLHYGRELLADTSQGRQDSFRSSNRHVFTDLGVFASKQSASTRLLHHTRLFEFLGAIFGDEVSGVYFSVKESGVPEDILPEACFFLALDAASQGRGMPKLDLNRINSIVVTGGVSKTVSADRLARITDLFTPHMRRSRMPIYIDEEYRFWIYGLERVPTR